MIYLSHLIEDAQMKELIGTYDCGVESIDFSIAMCLDEMEETLKSYEKRLAFMECRELSLHGPFLDLNPIAYDKYVRQITLKRYNECYEAAKRLGAKRVVYHTCYIPKVYMLIGWAERVIEFYEWFLDDKDDSIEIVMENVQDPKIAPILQVAESIDHPAFGLCLDVGHAHCYADEDLFDWVRILKSHIRHLHLHDNDGSRDSHACIGSGNIPMKEVLAELFGDSKASGPSITIENNSMKDMEESLLWLRKEGYLK